MTENQLHQRLKETAQTITDCLISCGLVGENLFHSLAIIQAESTVLALKDSLERQYAANADPFVCVQTAIENQGITNIQISSTGLYVVSLGTEVVGIGNTLAEALARKYSTFDAALTARREEMEKNLSMPA